LTERHCTRFPMESDSAASWRWGNRLSSKNATTPKDYREFSVDAGPDSTVRFARLSIGSTFSTTTAIVWKYARNVGGAVSDERLWRAEGRRRTRELPSFNFSTLVARSTPDKCHPDIFTQETSINLAAVTELPSAGDQTPVIARSERQSLAVFSKLLARNLEKPVAAL
jgi:hypothetical protein